MYRSLLNYVSKPAGRFLEVIIYPSNIQLENVVKMKSFTTAAKTNILRSITRTNLLAENERRKLI